MKTVNPIFCKMIPRFLKVTEVVQHDDSVVIIAPNHNAGRKGMYSTIRLMIETGKTIVIGRELPLGLSRQIACRPTSQDGYSLPSAAPKKLSR